MIYIISKQNTEWKSAFELYGLFSKLLADELQ